MATLTFAAESDGSLLAIYNDELADLMDEGSATVTRASHVEPNPNGAGWIADMAPLSGPVLGPFRLRQEALDAEVEWIKNRIF